MQKLDLIALIAAFLVEILRCKREIRHIVRRTLSLARQKAARPYAHRAKLWGRCGIGVAASVATSLFLFTHYVWPHALHLMA